MLECSISLSPHFVSSHLFKKSKQTTPVEAIKGLLVAVELTSESG